MTVTEVSPGPPLDAARPWPGLDAFSEQLKSFFFGRETETDELFRRVRRDTVTLLFGQSGLGKTSLLQAGLFPRLRAAGFLPILVRLDYADGAPSPAAQVKAALEREAEAAQAEATPVRADESLWAYFHRADRTLTSREGGPLVPVLVFDQFEEMFTLGLVHAGSRTDSQSFLGELAELIENRPPEALAKAIETDASVIENYRFDSQEYRIIITLREDFLAQLEGLRVRAPLLGRNRFRLRRMTGSQGLAAVTMPMPGLVEPELAREIVRFVGRANPEDAFGAGAEAGDGIEVEPALLSLVCRELNERRLALGLDQITPDLLAGNRESIIQSFYENTLADQPPAVRIFVEDELLSDSGFRESVSLERARRVLAAAQVPPEAIDTLVRRRLVRVEERLDVARIEIIHDVLTPVIRASRDTRHLRQAEADAAARERELRKARQRTRLAYGAAGLMGVLLLVAVGLGVWAYKSNQRAERNFEEAVKTADAIVGDAQRMRSVAGVQQQTVRALLETAEKTFDRLATIAPDSPYLRWRHAEMLIDSVYVYQDLGDGAGAQRRADQARDIMLALLPTDPTNVDYLFSLERTHRADGDALCHDSGQCADNLVQALAEYRAAVEIAEKESKEYPKNNNWRVEVAVDHMRVGQVLIAQGDPGASQVEYQASDDIFKDLSEKNPDVTLYQEDLAISDEKLGNVLEDQGDLPGALAAYRHELEISEELAAKDPNNTRRQIALSVSDNYIGNVLKAQGDFEGALDAYRKDQAICKRLALDDPGNTLLQRNLSVADNKIGDTLKSQGHLPEALAAYRDGLGVIKALAMKDPTNLQWQRDLSVSSERIGDVLIDQGDLDGALQSYRDELNYIKPLAQRDPNNGQWQSGLSYTEMRIGDVLKAKNDLPGALASYRDVLAIEKALALKNPGNTEWQRDVSITDEKIGDTLKAQGDMKGALEAYNESLALRTKLTQANPTNILWQHDLAVASERMGDMLENQKDYAGAIEKFQIEVTLAEHLLQITPSDISLPRVVFYPTMRIGEIKEQEGDLAGALAAFEKAEPIALHLKQINPTASLPAKDIDWVDEALLRVLRSLASQKLTARDYAGALSADQEEVAISRRYLAAIPGDATAKNALANSLGNLSWALLLNNRAQDAVTAAQESQSLNPALLFVMMNEADALLVVGRFDEAQAIYLANKDKKFASGRTFAEVVRDDFAALRAVGINTPDMARIEALLH